MKITAKNVKYATRIKDMWIGQTAYCVPWAYNPRTNTLDVNVTIDRDENGTSVMKVTRTFRGFTVDCGNYRY